MKHDWVLMGGDGSWELWRCQRCGRQAYPLPLLGVFWPWPRCVQ